MYQKITFSRCFSTALTMTSACVMFSSASMVSMLMSGLLFTVRSAKLDVYSSAIAILHFSLHKCHNRLLKTLNTRPHCSHFLEICECSYEVMTYADKMEVFPLKIDQENVYQTTYLIYPPVSLSFSMKIHCLNLFSLLHH